MTLTVKQKLDAIRKLIFGEEKPEAAPEQKPEAEARPEVEKPEDEPKPEGDKPETAEGEKPETEKPEDKPELTEAEKFAQATATLNDQIAALQNQMQVLSDFANLKSQVDYLSGWVKQQLLEQAAYKQAFSDILDVVETLEATPTGEPAEPRESLRSKSGDSKRERANNFISNLRAQRKNGTV